MVGTSMKIRFRRMNSQEFESYSEYSVKDYANDLVKAKKRTQEEADVQAQKEFSTMLPEGINTKDNHLMIIEDVSSGISVGIIWYLYEIVKGTKQVFLSDFFIYEQERRKGYATLALAEMEHNAIEDSCKESIIFVWKHNPPGVNLYTKCGYITFREGSNGMFMKKELQ